MNSFMQLAGRTLDAAVTTYRLITRYGAGVLVDQAGNNITWSE
jgi:hypothetical protein